MKLRFAGTADELETWLQARTIETVLCVVPDLWGRLMGKRLDVDAFLAAVFNSEGVNACSYLFQVDMEMDPRVNLAKGGREQGFPDFRMVPDLSTLRVLPWLSQSAIVICDACEVDSDELVSVAPRSILKRQLEAARRAGLAFEAACELEFYLYRATPEQAWNRGYRDLEPLSYFNADYHILQSSKHEDIIGRIRSQMKAADIPVESSKFEGGRGQQEISLHHSGALAAADNHVLYKNGVKEIATAAGLTATFMAKPSIDDYGSSCHIHLSLWDSDSGAALSASPDDDRALTPVMRGFLGGQMKFARELSLLYANNNNSYKRLQPDSFAPTAVSWGTDNRSAAFRIVGQGGSLRLENRVPGADVNPYTALAGVVMSGLAGVRDALDPGLAYEGDAYSAMGIDQLPTNLGQAVELFGDSQIARDGLGAAVHQHLAALGAAELEAFERETVTDWEKMRYFERI